MLENTGQKTNKKTHYKNKHNQEKANNAKYSRTKLPYIYLCVCLCLMKRQYWHW